MSKTEEYIKCLGCEGDHLPDYHRIDHSVEWVFEQHLVLRTKDANRYCSMKCREEFKNREKVLGVKSKGVTKSSAGKGYRPVSMHQNSTLTLLERLYEVEICMVCFSWGHIIPKYRNSAFCPYHMSRPPKGFKCKNEKSNCKFSSEKEGICPKCKESLKPYWEPLPEGLSFMYEHKFLPKWIYAQMAQGRGLARGLETLDRAAEMLELGNGSRILDQFKVLDEMVRKIEKEKVNG